MNYQLLKERVHRANLALVEAGLVVLTWGNASGVDREAGVLAIKPSGVPYDRLKTDDIVIVSILTGRVIESSARPSSDTATHLHLYREFPTIGGVIHTHSRFGTCFAQALREIPCFGTTHADNFHGPVPVTRAMTDSEITEDYELNTGRVIVEYFKKNLISPENVPGILVASHGPFAWGSTLEKAVENAVVLEFSAEMAMNSLGLSPQLSPISRTLLNKHFFRKHGPKAYYGQI